MPANEIVRLPKDPAAPEWDGVYQRLGRPAKAEEYDFSAVKFQDGSALDDAFVGLVRDAAFKNGLSNEKAADLAASIGARSTPRHWASTFCRAEIFFGGGTGKK